MPATTFNALSNYMDLLLDAICVVQVTPSIGIAYLPDNGSDKDALLKYADQAMYRAKKAGGGRIYVAGPGW